MYQHILLAVDLTEISSLLVAKAKELADTFQAKLSVIHVVEPIPAYGYLGGMDLHSPRIEEAEKELAAFAEQYGIPQERRHVRLGPTKTEILEVAEEENVDLIVVGTHGRHGLSVLLGSTANAVLHGSQCDVLCIRYPDED